MAVSEIGSHMCEGGVVLTLSDSCAAVVIVGDSEFEACVECPC